MANKIQVRRDTQTNWESVNPILSEGELGYDKTRKMTKIGDGILHWDNLPSIGKDPSITISAPDSFRPEISDLMCTNTAGGYFQDVLEQAVQMLPKRTITLPIMSMDEGLIYVSGMMNGKAANRFMLDGIGVPGLIVAAAGGDSLSYYMEEGYSAPNLTEIVYQEPYGSIKLSDGTFIVSNGDLNIKWDNILIQGCGYGTQIKIDGIRNGFSEQRFVIMGANIIMKDLQVISTSDIYVLFQNFYNKVDSVIFESPANLFAIVDNHLDEREGWSSHAINLSNVVFSCINGVSWDGSGGHQTHLNGVWSIVIGNDYNSTKIG